MRLEGGRRPRLATQEDFEALVRRYARLMASAIRRVCGRRHRSLVPDVEQEVHLALWKRLGSGKEIAHPASYVYRVALLTALAVVRRQGGETLSLEETGVPDPPAVVPGGLEPAERARLIQEVLERLEPDEARALRAYLAGFNHVEVARLYGWGEAVARHRIYRTLERLREAAQVGAGAEGGDG
jgi:RNA polymerase sigma factor (sigma-70 family)